ncbi:fructosamine kinase family protein [Dactylosporangium sp. NPDC049140]|uniref:fructosamine kinase family protein n=1 Tax=Dactylosporangium sp. NPDC049140 TaxID=3155647 RepID=UPI0033ED41D4
MGVLRRAPRAAPPPRRPAAAGARQARRARPGAAEFPEVTPSLLHGDAQQNDLLTTAEGPVFIDVAPYYGHAGADLALVDYFAPVPKAYLAVVAVDRRAGFLRRIARVRCRHVGSAG